jgi:DNA-binding HxlR family transcriptional regulator/cold shock CspA family protein
MKSLTELVSYLSGTPKGVRVEHQPTDQKETAMQYDMSIIGNRPKPVYIEATITNFTKGGAAFAREADGIRDIFVPFAVVERTGLERGDQVIATTVPNRLYDSWTPDLGVLQPAQLFAIHVVKADEATIRAMQDASAHEQIIELPKPNVRDRILAELKEGPFRASALAKKLGERTHTIFDKLSEMHEEGIVARASLYSRGGQKQASHVVWGLTVDDLFPALDEDDVDEVSNV